jgi:uncharacterized membrane protein YeaQ/YmgE (transglycosylase-associated protein family)
MSRRTAALASWRLKTFRATRLCLAFCNSIADSRSAALILFRNLDIRLALAKHWGKAMGVIAWIILGLIAGFIGSKIVNKTGEGLLLDVALGVVGALVGGFIFSFLGAQGVTGLNIWSLFVAVVGAVIVLLVYRAVVKT